MGRLICIGDVHGCIDELRDLIFKTKLQPDDTLVFAGDLLHKGPDSGAVVKLVRHLSNFVDLHLVLGNHEEKHLRWIKHESLRKKTGKLNPMKHVEEYPDTQKQLCDLDIEFIQTKSKYYAQFNSCIVVHGGIPPSIKDLPSHDEIANMSGSERKLYAQLLRTRYVDPKGFMVGLGDESQEDTFWADTYDGRFGFCLFGHQPFFVDEAQGWEKVRHWDNAAALDYGCVHGGHLCAFIIDEANETVEIEQVKAKKTYQPRRSLSAILTK